MSAKPVIAVPACRRILDPHPFHMVGEKYLAALVRAADVLPWMVPLLVEAPVVDELIERVDGVFLTGSYSNVEPHHYGGEPSRPGTLHDPERDATTLPLIRRALERDVPLFAVCRGFQELNVALGGALHQHVEEVDGYHDHRENPDDPLEVQYGPSHDVHIVEGGRLHGIAGVERSAVNSLHGQGIARLADGVSVEARADDGLIEAFSVDGAGFALAVQWHPEWQVMNDPLSLAMFKAFGDAARRYADERPARQQTESLLSSLGTAGEA
jgi:putative glutamine amidotransferase